MATMSYRTEIKNILNSVIRHEDVSDTDRRIHFLRDLQMDYLIDKVILNGNIECFYTSLIDEALKTKSGRRASLLEFLDKLLEYVHIDTDKYKGHITNLQTMALALSTFHFCILSDFEGGDYAPFISSQDGIKINYQKFADTVSNIRLKCKNQVSTTFKNASVEYDLLEFYYKFDDLCRNKEFISGHFDTANCLALLIDSSVFNQTDNEGSTSCLLEVLDESVNYKINYRLAIGFIMNQSLKEIGIPPIYSNYKTMKVADEEDLGDWITQFVINLISRKADILNVIVKKG